MMRKIATFMFRVQSTLTISLFDSVFLICPLSLCEDHQNSICMSAAKATDAEKMLVLPYIHFLGGENENCYPVRSVKDSPC